MSLFNKGPHIKKVSEPIGPKKYMSYTDIVSENIYTTQPQPFQVLQNTKVGPFPIPSPGIGTTIEEPSTAVDSTGQYIFYTGNWYAAKSTDNGNTFTYVNPFFDFPTFCCDQDSIYDPNHNMFIWTRLGIPDNITNTNYIRVGISKDNLNVWSFHNIYPTDINASWTNQGCDFPQLGITNKYLYISINIFDFSSGSWKRTIMLRLSLDLLYANSSLDFPYFESSPQSINNFNFGIAQECPYPSSTINALYFASHINNSNIRIFKWDETTGQVTYFDRSIPSWNPNPTYNCTGPDGNNWGSRLNPRIVAGWHSKGQLGFLWSVAQGNGFNWPYVDAALLSDTDFSYISRPYIYNPDYACGFPFASPDILGNVGITYFLGSGIYNPSHAVGIWDEYTPDPSINGWTTLVTNTGTNGPITNSWGDYIKVRPTSASHKWVATGYTLQNGNEPSNVDRRYIVFGRSTESCPTSPVVELNIP